MPPEEPAGKSPLDKPLHELTEDDIAQLTREDCRRYLKEKGMRRPSWNKSQAIQQVISLKKLLETTPDSENAGHSKRLNIPPPPDNNNNNINNNPHRVPRNVSANVGVPELAEETATFKEKDSANSSHSGELPGNVVPIDNESAPPRTMDSPEMSVGQMTIFYCGKVNVYDDVPADKAQAIMHLAASPFHFAPDSPSDGHMVVPSSACQLQGASARAGQDPAAVLLPASHPVRISENSRLYGEVNRNFHEDNPVEGPGSRKASVQRYLEKRKDRFKSKRKVEISSPASLDIYINHQMGNQQTEQTIRGKTCSPSHVRPPNTPTRCSSGENIVAKDANHSSCFNDKDIKE